VIAIPVAGAAMIGIVAFESVVFALAEGSVTTAEDGANAGPETAEFPLVSGDATIIRPAAVATSSLVFVGAVDKVESEIIVVGSETVEFAFGSDIGTGKDEEFPPMTHQVMTTLSPTFQIVLRSGKMNLMSERTTGAAAKRRATRRIELNSMFVE